MSSDIEIARFMVLLFLFLLPARTTEGEKDGSIPVASSNDGNSDKQKPNPLQEKKKSLAWEDPSPGRVIASQTAFTQKKRTFSFLFSTLIIPLPVEPIIYNFFDASYGIFDNLEFRIGTFIPIGYVGAGVYPKFSIPLNRYIRLGYSIDFAVFKGYAFEGDCYNEEDHFDSCKTELVYGGSPLILTIGGKNHYLNLTIKVVNFRGYSEDCWTDLFEKSCTDDLHNQIFVFVTLGASIRLSKWIKLNLELWYENKHDVTSSEDPYALTHGLWPMLGLKITGRTFYGEFNLISSSCVVGGSAICLLYLFPMISFGFTYPT